MTDRKKGWYWIKVEDLPPNDAAEWEAAQWDGRNWHVTGTDHEWSDASIDVVGPRIPSPNEIKDSVTMPRFLFEQLYAKQRDTSYRHWYHEATRL